MDERVGSLLSDGLSWLFRQLGGIPRRIFGRWVQRLPLEFRVLYKQFLLRILDLESLSIEADMVEYLGQFAGILIFISLLQSLGLLLGQMFHPAPPAPVELYLMGWAAEHGIVEKMLLVAGLVVVFLWDAPFPDRRDVMVLGPLPVRPGTILAAKLTSSAAVLGVAVVCLNWATNFAWPGVLGGDHTLRLCGACWLAVTAASVFLFATILAAEGLGTLLFPRRVFLRMSALGQLGAFTLFPVAYFLLGQIDAPDAMLAAENHWTVACWPGYWFLAMLKQLAGELPPQMNWLAWRAWIALACSVTLAAVALIACYRHALPRISEHPDLEPGESEQSWRIPFGGRLQTELMYFSLRTLQRSRQHRIMLAFVWSLIVSLALGMARAWLQAGGPRPLDLGLLVPPLLMMALGVAGMRGIFALPISLKANWMLRVTQLRRTEDYFASTRRVLLLLAVVPVWFAAGVLSLAYRPLLAVAGHLLLLAIFGLLAIEISLIGFAKLPFSCSFLPGKVNMQYVFWGSVVGTMLITLFAMSCELPALKSPPYFSVIAILGVAAVLALRFWNRSREREAELYFEEKPEPPLITLGLMVDPRAHTSS